MNEWNWMDALYWPRLKIIIAWTTSDQMIKWSYTIINSIINYNPINANHIRHSLVNCNHTFFIIPVFLLEKVVYLRSLLSMNSILILTRPLVFLPLGGGAFLGLTSALLLLWLGVLLLLLLCWLWLLFTRAWGFPPPPPLALRRWPNSGEWWLWLLVSVVNSWPGGPKASGSDPNMAEKDRWESKWFCIASTSSSLSGKEGVIKHRQITVISLRNQVIQFYKVPN